MTPLALLTYPNIDPIAIEYGPISIKWYGIAYLAGLVLGWLYIRRLISTPRLWFADKPPMTLERVDDLLLYMTGAVIIGGRLGQVLLYDPDFYFANPAEIVKVFHSALFARIQGFRTIRDGPVLCGCSDRTVLRPHRELHQCRALGTHDDGGRRHGVSEWRTRSAPSEPAL
jgi:hypothetical protein